ncbi:flagellar filament capping protein FliD [Tissierella praeacuta]|uniref:flagellar filament capping protein FliD n=1 Tax=Tissierella praeacuta TaxID=43131 RepID=UPI0028AF7398|nr:flagellar filament capping protein FliD [Tissierella praeacuta]
MSNMRIPGLASGMDTDAMVQSMMKVERLKVDRYEQSKQIALWRQEAYINTNKMFANFILNTQKDMGLKKASSTGSLSNVSYSRLDYVRKATSSNETAATVSATSEVVNGSYNIEVKELAKGASFSSAKLNDKALENVKHLKFKLNDKEIEVGSADRTTDITMDDVVKAINSAKVETYQGKRVIDGKVEIEGKMEPLTEEQKKQVKEESLGVSAFYDKDNGRLFMQTTKTGEGQEIKLDVVPTKPGDSEEVIKSIGAGNIFIDKLNEKVETGKKDVDGNPIYTPESMKETKGTNSKIIFNGVELTYSSNNINLNGLDIELKAEGITNINVNTNVDGIMEKIEKFVNDYNELIEKTSKLVSEKRYSNYHPLSQEEKKAMHEDDAKLWQEKAKSGMLNRDETIQRTLQNIRTDLYKNVEGLDGSFKHITEIGITTEKYSKGTTGGKLQIDKAKLRAAIEKDPEGVMKLLFNEPDVKKDGMSEAEYKKAVSNKSGVFTRIYDNLTDGMKSIIDKSGPGEDADLFRSVQFNILIDFRTKKSSISDLDKEILDANKKIDDLNVMLYRKENAYYAKFANMEKMLSQMNSQSNWLSQQFMR